MLDLTIEAVAKLIRQRRATDFFKPHLDRKLNNSGISAAARAHVEARRSRLAVSFREPCVNQRQ